jgi:hypothetical protein
VETQVLSASERKCCICYYTSRNQSPRKGQIAHLNGDASKSEFEDLVWLCLEHHDDFDSTTSQSKGLTPGEVRMYRDRLYGELRTPRPCTELTPAAPPPARRLPSDLQAAMDGAKGEVERLLAPWEFHANPEARYFYFPYRAGLTGDNVCRVERRYLYNGQVALICEQLRNTQGISVTNAIEELAFQLCARLGIPADKLVLIDYYPGRSGHYALVSFQQSPPAGMFANPVWQDMTNDDWRWLGLPPRTPRKG